MNFLNYQAAKVNFYQAVDEAALENFCYSQVTSEMVKHLAIKASTIIHCEPVERMGHHLEDHEIPHIVDFIKSIIRQSNVQVPTLMTTLVYLDRLKLALPPVAKGLKCTIHRIFLAALILSAKNLNDSSPRNCHWAEYSRVRGYDRFGFSLTEVNLMEKQLLELLDFRLNVTKADLFHHFAPFLRPFRLELLELADKDPALTIYRADQDVAIARHRQQQQDEMRQREEFYAIHHQQSVRDFNNGSPLSTTDVPAMVRSSSQSTTGVTDSPLTSAGSSPLLLPPTTLQKPIGFEHKMHMAAVAAIAASTAASAAASPAIYIHSRPDSPIPMRRDRVVVCMDRPAIEDQPMPKKQRLFGMVNGLSRLIRG